jgi:large subunit ribosomal protein L4
MSSLLIPKQHLPPPSSQVAVLDPSVFAHPIRRDILHLCVVHHLDCLRQGTASTKTRHEVKGSNRKLIQQKGSGRARVGDAKSPIRRGGGVVFGPKPRDFSTKLPRKVLQMGMRVALSAKVKDQRLGVVECLAWPGLKTKHLAQRIDYLGWRKTLFVTGEEEVPVGLERCCRNLQMVDVSKAKELDVYNLLKWERIVMDLSAVDWFVRTFGRNAPLAAPLM